MMRRRTNAKDDPNRNLQLYNGEVQFEPASVGTDGGPLRTNQVAISTLVGAESRYENMVRIRTMDRTPGASSSSFVWLTREELGEFLAHLNALYESLPSE